MRILKGLIADFDNEMVVHKDIQYVGSVRGEIIELTVEYSELVHVEVLIGGYNEDERALYEVPEVRRWINLVYKRWPDILLWLTPASIWVFILCLNPDMFSRLPDGKKQIAIDVERLAGQFGESHVAGAQILLEKGMTEDAVDRVLEQGHQNFRAVLEQKRQLAVDYNVLHPKDGKAFIYRMTDQETD